MSLVGLERRFKRGTFGVLIALEPMRLRKIEPQSGGARVSLRRRLEMMLCFDEVAAVERFDAEHIMGSGIVTTEAQCGFGLTNHVGTAPLLLRLNRQCEMLLYRRRHDERNDCRFRARSSCGMTWRK